MRPNPINWCEIYVQDMERAKRFYESVFRIKLEKLESPDLEIWAFPMEMNKPGAAGALVKMEGVSSGGSGTLLYFLCDDVAVESERVVEAGGKIHKQKTSIGQYGFMALAIDSEGNMIGLHMPSAERQ